MGFRLDHGLPVWTFEVDGLTIEKRVYLPHRQNTTYIRYCVPEGSGCVTLQLRPAINFRGHEAPVNSPLGEYEVSFRDHHFEVKRAGEPPMRLLDLGKDSSFVIDCQTISNVLYEVERNRGYTWRGDLWTPGYFYAKLSPGADMTLVASTEAWEVFRPWLPNKPGMPSTIVSAGCSSRPTRPSVTARARNLSGPPISLSLPR
jgi:hypothetical protein